MQTDPEGEAAGSGRYKMNSGLVTEQEDLSGFPGDWHKTDPSVCIGRRRGGLGS